MEEINNNKSSAHDPVWLVQLLHSKIAALGQSITTLQQQNFKVEDEVLDRMNVLKKFNDDASENAFHYSQWSNEVKSRVAQKESEFDEEIVSQNEDREGLR